jgi:hypothetical protein
MNKSNRDLLVLFKHELMTPKAIEQEVEWLHEMLYDVERIDNFASAHEIIDLCKYKISGNPVAIKKAVRLRKEQAFIFLSNKN